MSDWITRIIDGLQQGTLAFVPLVELHIGPTHDGAKLIELLRIHAALERIAATGARYSAPCSPLLVPLEVWFYGECATKFGNHGDPITADIAEEAAAWAEARVAPKVAKCPCCGKRCE